MLHDTKAQVRQASKPILHTCARVAVNRALWFWPYRAFFFGSAFFCAELFFLVGLFFLGSAVFFGIQLNLRLVNYLLMAAEYFSFIHVVFQKLQLCSQKISEQRYAYKGIYDI